MQIAKIIGDVVVTMKDEKLSGIKLMVLQPLDPDGTPLPVSIVAWPPGVAEVWIKVPKIDGASKTDYVTMYWGNPAAAGIHGGSGVFDTTEGWAGVWHLQYMAARGASKYLIDATAGHNDAEDFTVADCSVSFRP